MVRDFTRASAWITRGPGNPIHRPSCPCFAGFATFSSRPHRRSFRGSFCALEGLWGAAWHTLLLPPSRTRLCMPMCARALFCSSFLLSFLCLRSINRGIGRQWMLTWSQGKNIEGGYVKTLQSPPDKWGKAQLSHLSSTRFCTVAQPLLLLRFRRAFGHFWVRTLVHVDK